MFTSIRAKLGIVFLGFLLLGAGSVTATFVTVNAQAADALVINLAGRQRMLTQRMTKASLGIASPPSPDEGVRDRVSDYRAELEESATLFDRTLTALLDGGTVIYGDETATLPPTADAATRAQLAVVIGLWTQFRQQLETLQAAEPESAAFTQAIADVEALSPDLLQEMDRVVQLYEDATGSKLTRLRAIQAIFAAGAVGLLVAGYSLMQRTIVFPVSNLEAACRLGCGAVCRNPTLTCLTSLNRARRSVEAVTSHPKGLRAAKPPRLSLTFSGTCRTIFRRTTLHSTRVKRWVSRYSLDWDPVEESQIIWLRANIKPLQSVQRSNRTE